MRFRELLCEGQSTHAKNTEAGRWHADGWVLAVLESAHECRVSPACSGTQPSPISRRITFLRGEEEQRPALSTLLGSSFVWISNTGESCLGEFARLPNQEAGGCPWRSPVSGGPSGSTYLPWTLSSLGSSPRGCLLRLSTG